MASPVPLRDRIAPWGHAPLRGSRHSVPRAWTFGNKMKTDERVIEARAKIFWGESSSSVHDFLVSNGISAIDADAKIVEFNRERNTEIKKRGIKKSIVGIAILGGGSITLYPLFRYFDSLTHVNRPIFILVFVAGGLYGMWNLVGGIRYIVRPQSEHRSITDISE
jgi:hypothetical protein